LSASGGEPDMTKAPSAMTDAGSFGRADAASAPNGRMLPTGTSMTRTTQSA
jgi:hypothetical protein